LPCYQTITTTEPRQKEIPIMSQSHISLSICALFIGATLTYALSVAGMLSTISLKVADMVSTMPVARLPVDTMLLYFIPCLVLSFAWIIIFMRRRRS
jgi:hypothetical protein